jgi:hypothetical protein
MRNILLLILLLLTVALQAQAQADKPSTFQKAMDVYLQDAGFLIRNNIDWRMVRASDAEAVVVIRFKPDGKFESAKIEERSGNQSFDVALESAVRRSIPMLQPPPHPAGCLCAACDPVAISRATMKQGNTLRVMFKPLAGGTLEEYLSLVPRDRPEVLASLRREHA